MRYSIVFVLILALAAPAMGQAGSIGLFSDTVGMNCSILDVTPGLIIVHVIHVLSPGATASWWAVQDGVGFTATWLADTFPFCLGFCCSHCPEGVAISYGQCLSSPVHIGDILYFGSGTSSPCSTIDVIAAPAHPSGIIEVIDCNQNSLEATGLKLVVNPNAGCPCDQVPAEETTWGKLKALYVN